MSSNSEYPFRHLIDGAVYISFCRNCFLTVAVASNEADLAGGEHAHKCKGTYPLPHEDGHTTDAQRSRFDFVE
jgi:hypothetical protein